MKVLRLLLVLCVGILLWITCTTEENERAPLSEAIHAVDNNPQEALVLLESILDPGLLSAMDQDQYMQYVVVLTQAQYMTDQDITGDSLILDAQRYFAKTQNYEMAARASYYAAIYWFEDEVSDKAVEYWQAAFYYAERADNKLFMIKSAYGLGLSYYSQEQWEEAMTYFQKTLESYENKPDADSYKLDIINMLGHIYREQKDFEQAYSYFDNGLQAAKKLNNVKYESRFLRNKGIIHWEKKQYRQAKEYFDLALAKQPEPEDQLRIYLSYAKLYEAMNRPDSALHYLSMIENRIPEITYPNTRRDIYQELATYYQTNKGDANKVALYSKLAYKEDIQIKKSQTDKKIEALNQKLEQLEQKKQTQGQKYSRIFDSGIVAGIILAACLIVLVANWRMLKDKYRKLRQNQLSRNIDQLRLLMTGLRSVAKSTDDLLEKELAYAGSPVWEQLLVLREEFIIRIAECARQELKWWHNGKKVLSELPQEDLAIIYISQQKLYSNEEIGWILGYQTDRAKHIGFRKDQIRRIMTNAKMRNWNIKILVP